MSSLGDLVRRATGGVPVQAESGFGQVAADGEMARVRLRRPILLGSLLILALVLGLFLWAAIASVSGAVLAPGTVRVENNSKTLRHREGGIVREILVHEGQRVKAGQVLMRFDPIQGQASVDLFRSAYDSALANAARFQAEAANASDIRFPAELLARQSDPQVAALLAGQRSLFQARMMLYRSQATVLAAQAGQLGTQIQGMQAQAASIDAQSGLVSDVLGGVQELEGQGYAPRSRLLALQRSAAAIKGQRGQMTADIARARQSIGQVRLQIAQLDDKRQSDAADGLRQAQEKLTDAGPKLRATQGSLDETVVKAPVDGYVFNLSQFTEGGVAAPGEQLLQIVPIGSPLVITARVKPADITDVRVGMQARVTLSAYNPRTTPQVEGKVILVGADAINDEATKQSYYQIQVSIDPAELAKAGPKVRLTPGMPTMVAVVTGSRTILDYLLAPLTDAMRTAMRER